MRVVDEDVAKTTCVTQYGAFEFLLMPFELTNDLATICKLMNQVFYDYLDKLWLSTWMILLFIVPPWKITLSI